MAGTDSLQVNPYNDGMQKVFQAQLWVALFGGLAFLLIPRTCLDLSLQLPADVDKENPLWPIEICIFVQFIGCYLLLISWYCKMASAENRFPVRQNYVKGIFIFAISWLGVLVRAWFVLPKGLVGIAGYSFGFFALSLTLFGAYYGWVYKQPTKKD